MVPSRALQRLGRHPPVRWGRFDRRWCAAKTAIQKTHTGLARCLDCLDYILDPLVIAGNQIAQHDEVAHLQTVVSSNLAGQTKLFGKLVLSKGVPLELDLAVANRGQTVHARLDLLVFMEFFPPERIEAELVSSEHGPSVALLMVVSTATRIDHKFSPDHSWQRHGQGSEVAATPPLRVLCLRTGQSRAGA